MRESDLFQPVRGWLEAQALIVEGEVWTGDGVCDVVGYSIDAEAARQRVAMRRATPLTQATLHPMLLDGEVVAGPGWLPLHRELIFVELKVARMGEVFRQARRHRHLGRSYAALPMDIAEKCLSQGRWAEAGIGLLGVDGGVKELLRPRGPDCLNWRAVLLVERFWRKMRQRKAGSD